MFISCVPINKIDVDTQLEDMSYSNTVFSNKYIYIDSENSLCLKDINSEEIIVLNREVLEFKNSSDFLVFTSKDLNNKNLKIYNLKTAQEETLKDYYTEDFLVKDDYLFYIENNSIKKLNLNSKEEKTLIELGTNDVVLNFVDDKLLTFSYIVNSTPTTYSYNLNSGECKEIAKNSTNIVISNNIIYGLDSNFNIFKVDTNGNIDTVSNYPVLKFSIDSDYIVYIDTKGSLNTLDSRGNKRVISDSVIDFKRIGNTLYYISASSENKVLETQLTGRHKKVVLLNSSPMFNFNLIN